MTNVPVSIHIAWNIISFLESKLWTRFFFSFLFFFLAKLEKLEIWRWIVRSFALAVDLHFCSSWPRDSLAAKKCRTKVCDVENLDLKKKRKRKRKRRCKSRQLYSVVGFWLNSCLNDLWHYTFASLFLHFPIKIGLDFKLAAKSFARNLRQPN